MFKFLTIPLSEYIILLRLTNPRWRFIHRRICNDSVWKPDKMFDYIINDVCFCGFTCVCLAFDVKPSFIKNNDYISLFKFLDRFFRHICVCVAYNTPSSHNIFSTCRKVWNDQGPQNKECFSHHSCSCFNALES